MPPKFSLILLFYFYLIPSVEGQTWKKYFLDDHVSVDVPFKIDTLKIKEGDLFISRSIYGSMIFNTGSVGPIGSHEDEYSGFIKGYLESGNGTFLDSNSIYIEEDVAAKHFRVREFSINIPVIVDIVVFSIHGKIYIFQYFQNELNYQIENPEKNRYFGSIRYSKKSFPSNIDNKQKSTPYNVGYKIGYVISSFFLSINFIGMILAFIATPMIYFIRKKKMRANAKIKGFDQFSQT
ncbi:hypothetical protein BH09BAC5_BH09BAC5_10540 [soil metagenome]